MTITMAHGAGGQATSELIAAVFAKYFSNPILNRMEDAAVVPGSSRIAVTTDSFVVNPLFFPGGDIGRLSICGTVNDLAVSGAVPKYLTCGFILEEGADTDSLERIAASMAAAAAQAGVNIVAGDTKVIEGSGGIYINTSGVGFVPDSISLGADNCTAGDAILVSGHLGDHHAAILSARMGIENQIQSDCAPLNEMVSALLCAGIQVKAIRDITRGGLATILHEFANASGCGAVLQEESLPVSDAVRAFCGILGLDPLYMGNEGKLAIVVAPKDTEHALSILQADPHGKHATIVGTLTAKNNPPVIMQTAIGGTRIVSPLYGEGLPRIC